MSQTWTWARCTCACWTSAPTTRSADQAVAEITAQLVQRYPDPMRLGWVIKAAHAEMP